VKQGAIVSTTLFCVNLDVLLTEVKKAGLGCLIGTWFAAAYADDLILIAPFATMLAICGRVYTYDSDVVFLLPEYICHLNNVFEISELDISETALVIWMIFDTDMHTDEMYPPEVEWALKVSF